MSPLESGASLQLGAVPAREVGGSGVGALAELEEPIVGRRGLAHAVVWQNEFAHLLMPIGALGMHRRPAESRRVRISVSVEGRHRHALVARPEADAADLVGIGL